MENDFKIGFLQEAAQLVADAEQCFLTLESNPDDKETLERIFRLAHNLKGSSNAVGFTTLSEFTHKLESFLLKLQKNEIQIQAEIINLLLRCNDNIAKFIELLKNDLSATYDFSALASEIQNQSGAAASELVDAQETDQPAEINSEFFAGDLEEELKKLGLDTPSAKQEEILPAEVKRSPSSIKEKNIAADETIRVSLQRLDKLLNFVGEMVILQAVLKEQSQLTQSPLLIKTTQQVGKVTKEIQDISMSLRMIPLRQAFQKMQRIVRDTSQSLGKKVNFTLRGEDTEVDKTVLESLSDPLVHLIRNALDHGIESSDERIAKGKSPVGEIELSAYHQGGSLIIEIKDDGAGINADKIRQKAIEKGIIQTGETLTDKESYHLIFHSGFSTKTEVTDVSGRGVGMDVVKTNIEQFLHGDIQIETGLGKGTCFKVRLPLTLAIVDGMIVRSQENRYVIPLSQIYETLKPTGNIHKTTGIGEVLSLRGENLPLYRLNSLLHYPEGDCQLKKEEVVFVVRATDKPFSVLVDDILGQQQVVIKKLGCEHGNVKGFSGSAILGDGKPALILELGELVKREKNLCLVNDAALPLGGVA